MLKKSVFVFIVILSIFILIGSVSAATYGISNSTDSDTISKMISGKIPIKDNKFIKNGDVVKFRAGDYNNLKLIVNKRITITTTKDSKGKVRFIGKNKGIAINLKNNKNKKINIIGLKISKYDYGIYGKLNSGKISKNLFYKNLNKAIAIKGSKNSIVNNRFIKSINGLNIVGNYNKVNHNKIKGNSKENEVDFSENGLNIVGNYNSIYKNKIYYFNSGIYIQGNKNIIKKNSAYKCSEGMGFSFGKKTQ
ncbi:hypothetical protein [Methanobrevibacter curvatus]|uniref:Right handed beta helix domain-containing protein n=1 Tax=Methanobrevibacter curvatus TaxID=49547 RepID=A0A166CQE8_9EURY|nr:hypothetical protein [Methanobrevibacter curvatus]KZX16027.1 hypothetical protein MBCUR_01310 [Methanobrevibacter curvatus]